MPGPLQTFLDDVRQIRASGQGTAEQSYYPAVHTLLDEVGQLAEFRLTALAHPAGVNGQFPDVGLYEAASNVLALPVEVKGANATLTTLARSGQARRYARTFGGGMVLVTNLRAWALVEFTSDTDPGTILGTVELASTEAALDQAPAPDAVSAQTWHSLRMMIQSGVKPRPAQQSPRLVAQLMAYHARNMRDAIQGAGDPQVILRSLRQALVDGLQIDLDSKQLVPTVVQTLVYGEFASWLTVEDPQNYDWMQASYKLTVPVFAEILHGALQPSVLRTCDLVPHLKAVERVLRWTDRDQFAAQFDGDAIQYFYEPFLAEFDENLRDALGVWYTPREIAEYQVARAHHHVVHDLGVADGLADPAVYLLDPATGTGTYLLAAIDFLVDYHRNNGEPDTVAAQRALEAITLRFIGFEILPAAFIICHLHLARRLQGHGAVVGADTRLRVYLTNSLTGWDPNQGPTGLTLFPELETELADAARAKQTDPVVVVLGNPPYQGYSKAASDEERAMLQPWVDDLSRVWGLRKHRLNDLYVRFWRMSLHRILTLSKRGVVSFITNRQWLGGRSYPSMRAALVEGFSSVWVDDLHGGVHEGTPGDQSIFTTNVAVGIRVGTAIVTAVKTPTGTGPATVHLADYTGSAAAKRTALAARRGADMSTGYATPSVTAQSRYRFVADAAEDYPSLDEYLPTYFSGVQPVRDEAVVAFDKATLEARMRDYFDPAQTWAQVAAAHPGFAVQRTRYDGPQVRSRLLAESSFKADRLVPFLVKPYDVRWLYWEPDAKLLNEARRTMMPYWQLVEGQVCLVAPQTRRRPGAARPLATPHVTQFEAVDPNARVFPLYPFHLSAEASDEGELGLDLATTTQATMVAPEWVQAAQALLGCDDQAAGEAVFYALVAITHSPDWLAGQAATADDFPLVPVPADAADLATAAALGRRLLALADPLTPVPGVTTGTIEPSLRGLALPDQVTGTVEMTYGSHGSSGGQYDPDGQGAVLWAPGAGFRNVPAHLWEYSQGGFAVLRKWLSYRRNTGLTAADRETFRLMCRRIQASLDATTQADQLYARAKAAPLLAAATGPVTPLP